jgi:hypothetical protein
MPRAGFEAAITASERSASATGWINSTYVIIVVVMLFVVVLIIVAAAAVLLK